MVMEQRVFSLCGNMANDSAVLRTHAAEHQTK